VLPGSCEFVEKLAPHCPVAESSPPLDFLILEKIETDRPAVF
jgi:hypothetical protein